MTVDSPPPVAVDPGLDACPDAVVTVDEDDCVLRWNAACERTLGVLSSFAVGRPLSDVLTLTPRGDRDLFPERHWAVTGRRRVPVEVVRWTAMAAGAPVVHVCLRDSTARLALEDEADRAVRVLHRQARSDALTGLANRFELHERLADLLGASHHDPVAVAVVDLDGFKPINDRYGHGVGDEVLSAVAARLVRCVRSQDTVARVGGDEFVLLTRLGTGTAPSGLRQRVCTALQDPVQTSEGLLTVGASVGVAVSEPDQDPAELLRRADKAMYRAKAQAAPRGAGAGRRRG